MKLCFQEEQYIMNIDNVEGFFSNVKINLKLPKGFFELFAFIKNEKEYKDFDIQDAFISLTLLKDNDIIFSVSAEKLSLRFQDEECFFSFGKFGVPLSFCINTNDINFKRDIPVKRALINSTNFIFS